MQRLAVSVERATSDVALELQIEEGHEVFVRDRTMRADGQVAQLATSYLPRALTADTQIEAVNSGPGGIYARLEEAGHTLTGYVERVAVRIATAQEEEAFGLRRGDSVIHLTRIAIAEHPVEVNFIRMPAVRFELVYELPAQ